MSDEIKNKLTEIVVSQLGVEAEKVTEEASFISDLEADSLDVVVLVMAIEEEFEIEIDDEAAGSIATVGDVLNYLQTTVEKD